MPIRPKKIGPMPIMPIRPTMLKIIGPRPKKSPTKVWKIPPKILSLQYIKHKILQAQNPSPNNEKARQDLDSNGQKQHKNTTDKLTDKLTDNPPSKRASKQAAKQTGKLTLASRNTKQMKRR